jgi:hypothetical protein
MTLIIVMIPTIRGGTMLIVIFLSLCISLHAADHAQEKHKEHTLDDLRLCTIFTHRWNYQSFDTILRPCKNPKLNFFQLFYSLNDTKLLTITQRDYYGLMHIAAQQWEDAPVPNIQAFRNNLIQYLDEGYDYQIAQAVLRYYPPLICWASRHVMGISLPKECCEKIASYIDVVPSCAPCKIFKAEVMIMLRYAFFARPMADYKQYYQFSDTLNALW